MNDIKISVVIPNYNKGEFLNKCIDSIFNQSYKPFDVIVVDDCSTDNSKIILKELNDKYGSSLKTIFLEENNGVSHARNIGIKNAKGNYLIWIDSDDFFINDKYFEYLNKYCSKNKLVYGHWISSDIHGTLNNTSNLKFFKKTFSKNFTKLNLLYFKKTTFIPRNFIIHKSILYKVGYFDENMSLYEDTDLLVRISKIAKFMYLNVFCSAYRQTNNGLSKASLENHKKILNELRNKYSNYSFLFYKKIYYLFEYILNKLHKFR